MDISSKYDTEAPYAGVYLRNRKHKIKAATVDSLGVEDVWWEIYFDTIHIIKSKKMIRLIKRKDSSKSIWRRLCNFINI